MKVKIFIAFFLIVSTSIQLLYGQDQGTASGVVMSNGSNNRLSSANIYNLKNGVSVQSNDLGIFKIKALPGDTLQIANENFNTVRVVVQSPVSIIIRLTQKDATMLQQVDVYSNNKLKSLAETQQNYRKKGSYYGGKPPVLAVIFSPISGLYELFGKTPGNARKFSNYYKNESQASTVDNKFNRYLIEKYTPLRNVEVETFMFKYRPDYKISQNWNVYQSIDYIKKQYANYELDKKNGTDSSIPDLNKLTPAH